MKSLVFISKTGASRYCVIQDSQVKMVDCRPKTQFTITKPTLIRGVDDESGYGIMPWGGPIFIDLNLTKSTWFYPSHSGNLVFDRMLHGNEKEVGGESPAFPKFWIKNDKML